MSQPARHARAWAIAAVLFATACGSAADERRSDRASADAHAASPRRTPAAAPVDAAKASRPKIVVLGDSLTAGLGLPVGDAYPMLLQKRLDAAKLSYEVVNAGISGDTSAGGLSRLDWALQDGVRILIV